VEESNVHDNSTLMFLFLTQNIYLLIDREKFITGEEDVAALPKDVQGIFTLVTEEDFRVDISSTEIRKRQTKQEQS
jgi:hypothetical protein